MRSGAYGNIDLREPLAAYRDYVGLKLHFNDQFVWHRDMRVNQKEEQLLNRKDAFLFIKFADNESDREKRIQKLISLFKNDKRAWIGQIFEEDQVAFHKRRMATIGALKYNFRTDISKIVNMMEEREIDIRRLLLNDGQSPYIIQNESSIPGGVSDETLALLERAFKFCSQPTIDPLWEERAFMLRKYQSWIDVDGDFLKQQLNRLVPAQT